MLKDARQQHILDEAHCFAEDEIRPYAGECDEKEVLPPGLIRKMAAKKYLSATFPEAYGGLDLDPVYYGLFTEVIGKACCSTRALLTVQTSLVGEALLRWGTQTQKEKWLSHIASGEGLGAFALSEPDVGSDAKGIKCTYTRQGNRFIISGHKKWISFGAIADFFIVIATCGENISAFLVERASDGVSAVPIRGMLGSRASYIAKVHFDYVSIPEENLLGNEGGGFSYVVSTALDHGRYSIAWAGVALAQEALEAMVSYARRREQFGQKIHKFQLIQGLIGDSVTKIHAARALCLRAGTLRKVRDTEAVDETMIAKYYASKVAVDVSSDAVQVHGGDGCSNEYQVARLFREAKIFEIIEGTSQIQQTVIAKYGLRKYYRRDAN